MKRQIRVKIRGNWHTVEVEDPQRYPFQVTVDGETLDVEIDSGSVTTTPDASRPHLTESAGPPGISAITGQDKKIIRSPMPGRIVSLSVKVWDEVESGTEVCVLEAMKMEQSVRLSQSGTIRAVFVHPDETVAAGTPLIQIN